MTCLDARRPGGLCSGLSVSKLSMTEILSQSLLVCSFALSLRSSSSSAAPLCTAAFSVTFVRMTLYYLLLVSVLMQVCLLVT